MTLMTLNRRISQHVAPVTRRRSGGGQSTGLGQDKSREVRGGRSVGKRAAINSLAWCATTHDSLPLRASY